MPTRRVMLTVALMAWGLASAVGAEADGQAADETAIRKAVESYVAAFNQGDAKALAAMWSREAVYTNPLSGEQVVGREAVEKQFRIDVLKNTRVQVREEGLNAIDPLAPPADKQPPQPPAMPNQ